MKHYNFNYDLVQFLQCLQIESHNIYTGYLVNKLKTKNYNNVLFSYKKGFTRGFSSIKKSLYYICG